MPPLACQLILICKHYRIFLRKSQAFFDIYFSHNPCLLEENDINDSAYDDHVSGDRVDHISPKGESGELFLFNFHMRSIQKFFVNVNGKCASSIISPLLAGAVKRRTKMVRLITAP